MFNMRVASILFLLSVGCGTEGPADSLQGLTSTFPCLATNLGLSGNGDCGSPDEIKLSVMNQCTEDVTLPASNGGSPTVLAPDASTLYPVPVQFMTGDESGCSFSVPIMLGTQSGSISWSFQ